MQTVCFARSQGQASEAVESSTLEPSQDGCPVDAILFSEFLVCDAALKEANSLRDVIVCMLAMMVELGHRREIFGAIVRGVAIAMMDVLRVGDPPINDPMFVRIHVLILAHFPPELHIAVSRWITLRHTIRKRLTTTTKPSEVTCHRIALMVIS